MRCRYITLLFLVMLAACSKNKKQESADADTVQVLYRSMTYSLIDSSDTKLRLLIDYDFGNSIILGDNTVEGIQSAHNNQFSVDSITVSSGGKSVDVAKLTHDNSYIKIYHNDYGGAVPGMLYDMSSDDLVCAVIVDRGIRMQNGIHIEMDKTDFFVKILGRSISKRIDTVQLGDEHGDIEYQFIFKNDRLNTVLATSTYKFADFNFH